MSCQIPGPGKFTAISLSRRRDQMLLESRSLTAEHMHEIRISVRSPRHCSLTGFHILGVLVSYLETGGKKVYISEW